MTVYISGPITGRPDNNKAAFKAAASHLRAQFHGIKVINPLAHIAVKLERQFAAKGKEPQWVDYMRACIKKMLDADCLFFFRTGQKATVRQ